MSKVDKYQIKQYLLTLQETICQALEQEDGSAKFHQDSWHNNHIIDASTRIISNGNFIEHAAVNFSHLCGNQLPKAATVRYPELAGANFEAMGLSLIVHPLNPHVPTTHANIRFFSAKTKNDDAEDIWWFGGGYDLTPYYPMLEDCVHWHQTANNACAPFGEDVYTKYKEWCDNYFSLPHRQETRGVGGLFFDDLNCWPQNTCFAFMQSIGNSFLPAYLPIVAKRKHTPFGEHERDFQLYRRGRYVEFNLIYDRGTLFGLQVNGRTESILSSLPPLVKWRYNWQPASNSKEALLYSDFLKPRDWLKIKDLVVL